MTFISSEKSKLLFFALAFLMVMVVIPTTQSIMQLVWFNLGNTFMLQAIIHQDPEASTRTQQLLSKFVAGKTAFRVYRSQTRLALLEKRFTDAKKYGEQAFVLSHLDWQTHDLLGRVYWELDEKEAARSIWRTEDLIRPRLLYLSHAGWQSFAQKDYTKGVSYFEQGIDYDPTWREGYWALSSYYWQEGQIEQAGPYLHKLAQLLPKNDAQYLFVMGRINLIKNDLNTARVQFCKAWEQVPNQDYWDSCLWGLWHQGMLDQALTLMSQSADKNPEQTATAAIDWGDRLFTSKNYFYAAQFYEIGCQLQVSSSEACTKQKNAAHLSR